MFTRNCVLTGPGYLNNAANVVSFENYTIIDHNHCKTWVVENLDPLAVKIIVITIICSAVYVLIFYYHFYGDKNNSVDMRYMFLIVGIFFLFLIML